MLIAGEMLTPSACRRAVVPCSRPSPGRLAPAFDGSTAWRPDGTTRPTYNDLVRSRGFTLIEVLAGLVILGLIMTTSLAIFFQRQKRLLEAEETVIVWQALANEAELQRHEPYAGLAAGHKGVFLSDSELLRELPHANASVTVRQPKPDYKLVTLAVQWRDGARHAELTLVRGDTGGSSLW